VSWVLSVGPFSVPLDALVPLDAQPVRQRERHVWQAEIDGQTLTFVLLPNEAGLELWWLGQRYPCRLEPEAVHALRAHLRAKDAAEEGRHVVNAHMPGLVTQVRAKDGEGVRRGDGLFVLEAMKMENELVAPAAGTVRELNVSVGQHVEKGHKLCVVQADTAD